ncbi:MAG: hypothetical protein NVS3B5_21780 [Sphingomicrobium sp.]
MTGMSALWNAALGIGEQARDLDAAQVAARAIVVYAAILLVVRFGKKRFLSRASAFDVIVVIIIGSVGSRSITGNAPLVPGIAGAAAIVALHWLLSAASLRFHGFGRLIKGAPRVLIRDGEIDKAALRAEHMTQQDLEEDLRNKGLDSPAEVQMARIERSGSVSVVKANTGL